MCVSNSHHKSQSFEVAGATHIGRARQTNQDSFLTVHLPGAGDTLLAVADGVGGGDVGDIASQLAIKAMVNVRMSAGAGRIDDRMNWAEKLQTAVREANLFLFKINHQFGNATFHTGTTLTALHLFGNQGMVFSIGDSRCYRLRKKKLAVLTRDDTVLQELVDEKKMSKKEAVSHPLANTLCRCVGSEPTLKTGFRKVDCASQDRFAVVTDGIWKMLTPDQITRALHEPVTAREAVDRLIITALREGSRDNLSACVALVQ